MLSFSILINTLFLLYKTFCCKNIDTSWSLGNNIPLEDGNWMEDGNWKFQISLPLLGLLSNFDAEQIIKVGFFDSKEIKIKIKNGPHVLRNMNIKSTHIFK